MAGLGYKLFVNGNTLSASDLNTYVQQQTVMVFSTTGARTTALSSVLAEGMVSYVTGTGLQYYTGSAWVNFDHTFSGSSSGSTILAASATASGTLTLPAATDTLVARTTTDTLTNKSLTSAREISTVSATAATGTINFDVKTQGVLYYTTNSSANWTLNVRGDGSTTLNTVMATGDSETIRFLVTNGSTAYYPTALTIDGTSVTPKWQGGTAPTAGNASAVDAYSYAIIKTGSAAFTVFASQVKFA